MTSPCQIKICQLNFFITQLMGTRIVEIHTKTKPRETKKELISCHIQSLQ